MDIEEFTPFLTIDLNKYITAVNEILETEVTKNAVINFNNEQEQSWARQGLKLHNHDEDGITKCIFCGSVIDEKRIKELNDYFNDSVKKLESRIDNGLKSVDELDKNIKNIVPLKKQIFYPELDNDVLSTNYQINETIDELKELIKILQDKLLEKKQDVFLMMNPIKFNIKSKSIDELNELIENLFNKNEKIDKALIDSKENARKSLLNHYIAVKIKECEYEKKIAKLDVLNTQLKVADDKLTKKTTELKNAQKKLKELLAKTKDEEIAVTNINKSLKDLGNQSFELIKVEDEDYKGQYTIQNLDGKIRDISSLSTGEKNLVAFLWFINDLKNPDKMNGEKEIIVVFDDPMTSNDDISQYLIIGAIQKIYNDTRFAQIFVLTHNNHFYMQVKPSHPKYDKQNYLRLLKNDSKTIVQNITSTNEDLHPMYDELWNELNFAYVSDKPIFMWNNMRRILETFSRFVYHNQTPRDIEKEMGDFEDKIFVLALLKSLNVNSHIGYETDIDISGKTNEELILIFEKIFEKLGAHDHFLKYWTN